jgi:class 3 adenylate cyclase
MKLKWVKDLLWRDRGSFPKFAHGMFGVLIIDSFDYVAMVTGQAPEEMLVRMREQFQGMTAVIRGNGGELVAGIIGPPVVGVWRCPGGVADRRILEAARALVERWEKAAGGWVMGASFGSMLFQEDRGVIVNVLGKVVERSDGLVELARARREVLVVDDAIAMLGEAGEFGGVGEGAWALVGPDANR